LNEIPIDALRDVRLGGGSSPQSPQPISPAAPVAVPQVPVAVPQVPRSVEAWLLSDFYGDFHGISMGL